MPEANNKVLLSDKHAKAAAPNTRYWDTKTTGLILQTGKTAKSWYLDHKGTRRKLGSFPEMSATNARQMALDLMTAQSAPERAPTLEEALRDYISHGGRNRALRSDHNKRSVDAQMRNHMAKFLNRRLDTITKMELRDHFEKIKVERVGKDSLGRKSKFGGERAAKHTMQSFRTIWNHARDNMMEGDLKTCPTSALRISDGPQDEAEIEIIDDLDEWARQVDRLDPLHRCFYRLLLLTGARKTEILSLTWDQIEDDHIFLPETKNGRAFKIPLEPEHLEIIEQLRVMRRNSVDWVFWSSKGDGYLKTPQKIVVGGQVVTAQMLRHTFATYGERAGLAPWEVGRLLNHTVPGVTASNYIKRMVEHHRPLMRKVLDALPV